MKRILLTNTLEEEWVEGLSIKPEDFEWPVRPAWKVTKRRLRGGRSDGVDLIDLDNGALSVAVVPTRGMGLWRANYQGEVLGWRSPVRDGPVNPAFVHLADRDGLGWLQGFDELMVRCGLETNGPPFRDDSGTLHPLHGRIANQPAHLVAIEVDENPPHAITLEGQVDESQLFLTQIRMKTRITTEPGSNRLTVRDEFLALGDSPTPMQLLYHWNFGPPYLEEGARFLAPIQMACPRDARAAEGMGHFDVYGPPEPGFAEQVYYFQLLAGDDGRTAALLRNRDGDKAVVLRFSPKHLPAFTLWKCTGGPKSGYVTGLEPAINYPNPTPFERARNRFVTLLPGQSFVAETILEVLHGKESVAAVEAEIQAIQAKGTPNLHKSPLEPFAAEP